MDAVADLAEDYSPRRIARLARAEPRSAACRARRPAGGLRPRWRRSGSPPPTPASSPTSSPAPASTIARSPPPARSRSRSASPQRFGDRARQREIGQLKIKISGCINACGHHHVGHIGILGVEQAGEETYQITLGGSGDETRRSARSPGRASRPRTSSTRSRRWSTTYMSQRRDGAEDFLDDLPARRHGAVQGGALRAQRRIGHLMSAHDIKLFGDQIAASRLGKPVRARQGAVAARLGDRGPLSRPHRARLELRRGLRGAAAHGLADRQGDAGGLRRHRPALSRDARLSRRALVERLGPDQRQSSPSPTPSDARREDPEKFLFASDPDRCCEIRKVRRWRGARRL